MTWWTICRRPLTSCGLTYLRPDAQALGPLPLSECDQSGPAGLFSAQEVQRLRAYGSDVR